MNLYRIITKFDLNGDAEVDFQIINLKLNDLEFGFLITYFFWFIWPYMTSNLEWPQILVSYNLNLFIWPYMASNLEWPQIWVSYNLNGFIWPNMTSNLEWPLLISFTEHVLGIFRALEWSTRRLSTATQILWQIVYQTKNWVRYLLSAAK